MQSAVTTPFDSKGITWTARVIGFIAVAFLLLDAGAHVAAPAPVVDAFNRLGIPLNIAAGLGVLELILVAVYVTPASRIFGAILLTGYLGGAVSVQLRAGSPPFEVIFPILFGILVWAPIYLLDDRFRIIFSLRR